MTFALYFASLLMFYSKDHSEENLCGILYPYYEDQHWKEGALLIGNQTTLNLYSDTIGGFFGNINTIGWQWSISRYDGNTPDHNGISDIGYLYDRLIIKVNQEKGSGFYRCFAGAHPGGLFLKKSEVINQAVVYFEYADLIYLFGKGLRYDSYPKIGVIVRATALNVRSGPSMQSKILGKVRSNELNPIGESRIEIVDRKGDWAKVRIVNLHYTGTYPQPNEDWEDWEPCPNTIHSELRGWLKVVDEHGHPKIWFSDPGGY